MLQTHREAEQRYERFRQQARQFAHELLPYQDKALIGLSSIDSKAISQSKTWAGLPGRVTDWDWLDGSSTYRRRYPKRFELAIWYGSILCGLTLGRPSYRGTWMRLDFVERRPGINPLQGRIVPISLTAIEAYAELLGAQQVRIMDPFEDVIGYYASFGYTVVRRNGSINKPSYLYKNLRHE